MIDAYAMMERLFPICRSLTGDGNRETLSILKEAVVGMAVHEIPSGTQVCDWVVPDEWNARSAWIEDEDGRRIVDFADSNLHLVGYSESVDRWMDLDELQEHLYSIEEHPDWIPYVTSYYKRRWGFCLADGVRRNLRNGRYHVFVDSDLTPGSMTYADAVLEGESDVEVMFTTYICHPSMANNELSGPCVAAALYDWLRGLPRRRFTYRFVFAPETLGSVAYIDRHLEHLKARVVAGFNLTCVGDDKAWHYMPSRQGNTLADRAALNILNSMHPDFVRCSFLSRGSDERQYCAPGVDLPYCSVMRSMYGRYPEYHTSADDLSFVSREGLGGSIEFYQELVKALEANMTYRIAVLGEPQLGRRGLYPTISYAGSASDLSTTVMNDVIAYADGTLDLFGISDAINAPMKAVIPVAARLAEAGLLKDVSRKSSSTDAERKDA